MRGLVGRGDGLYSGRTLRNGIQGFQVAPGVLQNPRRRLDKLKPELLAQGLAALRLVLLEAPHDAVLPQDLVFRPESPGQL